MGNSSIPNVSFIGARFDPKFLTNPNSLPVVWWIGINNPPHATHHTSINTLGSRKKIQWRTECGPD